MHLLSKISKIFKRSTVDDSFYSELEETLIEADVGVGMTAKFLKAVQGARSVDEIKRTLAEKMVEVFPKNVSEIQARPHVILVSGVNGVGKTTTIAKLAKQYQDKGKKVLIVAADTFRAAAVDQIKEWGMRIGVEVVSQLPSTDAAAVAFDGVKKASARGHDIVIVDTAGRLHTKHNLMEEIKKVARVIGRAMPGAPHERIIVIDATVGSNGLIQALKFHEALSLTGAIVTKLDGTAKGGVLIAIAGELGIPVTHIGIGEGMEDLKPFDPAEFVGGILG